MDNIQERLENLEHRIAKLSDRLKRQSTGFEANIANKLLFSLISKRDQLLKDNNIVIPEATSSKRNTTYSDDELSQRLGAIYYIFGPSYEETFSFKTYRIEFLRLDNEPIKGTDCLLRVQVHIYENDKPFLMDETYLEFWEGWADSAGVDDIAIKTNDKNDKYNNFHWFSKIAHTLKKTWNNYFREIPLFAAKKSGLIEAEITSSL